jgi:large subunit ribosomal protein L25
MAEHIALNAEARSQVGKGAARATRRQGRIPAVIYGDRKEPVSISLDPKDLSRELAKPGFFATLIDISVDGAKNLVLCRDLQRHPVTDRAQHADFLRVTDRTRIAVDVPVSFVNEDDCPGLRAGGVLNIVRHEIELNCRAGAIPTQITIDLAGHDIGDSIHISEVTLPDGVTPVIGDRDFTIATIAAPTVAEVEEAEGEEEGIGEEAAEAATEEGGEDGGDSGASED